MVEHGFRKAGVVSSTLTVGFFPALSLVLRRSWPERSSNGAPPRSSCQAPSNRRRLSRGLPRRAAPTHHLASNHANTSESLRNFFCKNPRPPLYTPENVAVHLTGAAHVRSAGYTNKLWRLGKSCWFDGRSQVRHGWTFHLFCARENSRAARVAPRPQPRQPANCSTLSTSLRIPS